MIDVKINRKIFNKKYANLLNNDKYRHIYMWGGASSGKSYAIAQILILYALKGEAILCARQTQVSLKKSVLLEFLNAITTMRLEKYFKLNKSEMTIMCTISQGSIQLVGCDNEDRVKSIRPIKQKAFSKLWIEEANEVSKFFFAQLNIRMRGETAGGFKKQSFYSWNPTYESHYLNTDILQPNGATYEDDWKEFTVTNENTATEEQCLSVHSTYNDNEFLTDEDVAGLLSLQEFSPYHYRVYGLGMWGVLGDRIFEKLHSFNLKEVNINNLKVYGGWDFGWTDETAFTLTGVDREKRSIYILGGFIGSKLTTDAMTTKAEIEIEKLGLQKHNVVMFGDSEDPRLIEQLQRNNFAIKGADKPAGSVLAGLMMMNTYDIYIENSLRKHKEAFENYVWETDKQTGKPIDKPNHNFSHIPDSARYSLELELRGFGNSSKDKYLKWGNR